MQGEAEAFLVSPEEAQRLIAAHDGDVALLWLFLRQRPGSTLEDAARALCRTRAELEAAYEKLQRLSLPAVKAAPAAAPAVKKAGPSLPVPEPAQEHSSSADAITADAHLLSIRPHLSSSKNQYLSIILYTYLKDFASVFLDRLEK